MRTKRIGRLAVPAIGQGAGGNDMAPDARRIAVLREGIDRGMTLIDTAEVYRTGESERIVGQAVRGRRDEVLISTKFSPHHHQRYDVLLALEGSLGRLETDYVDFYTIHWPNPKVPLEETFGALMDLQDAGKVRHIAVSNFPLGLLEQAQRICGGRVESNQVEYNLLERGPEEELLPYSTRHGVLTMAYNPLLRGARGATALHDVAHRNKGSIAQVILAWLTSRPTVVPIPKTLNLEHTRENAAAGDIVLDTSDVAILDEAFRPVVRLVEPRKIRIAPSEAEPVYTSLEQALANPSGLTPSPKELAQEIQRTSKVLKPVRLRPIQPKDGVEYELIQGRLRYWAWVIAYGTDRPIPAYVND